MGTQNNQTGTGNGTDIDAQYDLDALYDLYWDLFDIEKAIERLRDGVLRRAFDNESLGAAILYMAARDMDGTIEQENGLPDCVDNYLEYVLKMAELKMKKVNKRIEQLSGEE